EDSPDRLLDMLFVDAMLVLFGVETVEFWPKTTDPDLPFQPLPGRVFEKGIRATGCAAKFAGGFAWVTDDNEICLNSPENVISEPGLQDRIAKSTNVSLWTFTLDGIEYLALRLDTETQVYSARTRTFSEFYSYGQANWIPQCFARGVFGSSIDGRTFQWGETYEDLGGQLERRFAFGAPFNAGGVFLDNILLRTNPGSTPYLTGDYADPEVELRLSDDGGRTFDPWEPVSLGEQGQYRELIDWRALGMASHPGIYGEIRVTDPVDFRVSDVRINEPLGGR
ncbi:MAG: hypothetical protein ACRCYS_04535, partial [Beijerinckiaceae bacterium]